MWKVDFFIFLYLFLLMKTPSNDLFRLIKTMSAIERRQFKVVHNGDIGASNNTLDLFDIIANMEEYDEAAVKQQIKDASFAKNLKVHKNRLQQQILSYFRLHKTAPTPAERIREQVDYAEILWQRKLYDMSLELLERAGKQCEIYEEYELLLLVLGIKARQQIYFKRDLLKGTIEDIQKCLHIIDNYTKQAKVNDVLSSLFMQTLREDESLRVEKINAVVERDILAHGDDMLPISPIAARMYNHSMSIWRRIIGDKEGYCNCTRDSVMVCEKNPTLLKEKPASYFNILINHIIACQNAAKYTEMWECMSKMEDLKERFDYFQPHLIYGYHECVCGLKNQLHTDEAISFFSDEVQPLVDKFDLSQTHSSRLIYLKTVELFLLRKDYDMAAQLLEVLQPMTNNINMELADFALILEAIYYIERQEWAFLQSWTEALQKRMQRQKNQKAYPSAYHTTCPKVEQQHLSTASADVQKASQSVGQAQSISSPRLFGYFADI
jgi:tetratricopeptide (TPR) repeat protein